MLDVKEFVNEWKKELKQDVENMKTAPKLGIVQVGDNAASTRYVRNKLKDCEEIGIEGYLFKFDEEIGAQTFYEDLYNIIETVDGIIVQLPVPKQLDVEVIKSIIPDSKDVDGFNVTSKFDCCTPAGIIAYLKHNKFNFDGANALVIGRSEIVGKPVAKLLLNENATVTVAHSHTKNIQKLAENADLVICAVGKAHFLDCENINSTVIDVGINFVDGKLVGDCFNTSGKLTNEDGTKMITPVPGGVGLLTRCALLSNTVKAVKGV